jgi:hypothetical protein
MRELKADIKDDVWIKGQVEEIIITATGVKYTVNVFGIPLKVFEEDLETAPKSEPVKEPVKKGPGRPKKTTLDELVKKCTK